MSSRSDDDRALGMNRRIARRDFLNGVALGAGGVFASGWLSAAAEPAAAFAQDRPGYYPPALTGMRGSHPGSYENAHAVRDGRAVADSSRALDTGETYDLIVVGAGIGGLAAAHFFLGRKPDARILILDNHDDFGGHAKRNEFRVGDRLLLANGGTWAIESPFPYSSVARGLFTELGIDPPVLEQRDHHAEYYKGLNRAVFFDRPTFGVDRLVALPAIDDGVGAAAAARAWADFVAKTPLAAAARADVVRIETGTLDYFPDLSPEAKKERLSRMSYRDFLRDVIKAHPDAITFYQTRTHDLFAVGIDAVTALDCWGLGLPGFAGLHLAPGPYHRMGFTAKGAATPNQSPYTFHYPDGNASIARMLVRRLIPGALSGANADDIVTASADYSRLDRPNASVRMRLSSTVMHVRHLGEPATAKAVEVTYTRGQARYTVRAPAVVMAGWNMMIPYLMPELPDAQKEALHYGVKVPLVYTRVAIRNWRSFARLGVRGIETPGMYHSSIDLDEPVDIGTYRTSRTPDEPVVVRMLRTPCAPGLSERDQHRVGRADLLQTSFATFERNIRDQLGRVLGPGGFDPARDIRAITVNRWPHGYAYEYNPLWDPDSFFDGGPTPNTIARQRFGRVAIANSDAAAAAYTDKAIDEAYRAVHELPLTGG